MTPPTQLASAVAYVHADDQSPCDLPATCPRPHERAEARPRAHAGMPDGWRDVLMPPGVAELPTTRSGIPITYTVAWSSEREAIVRYDDDLQRVYGKRTLGVFASGAQGEGTPKLDVVSTDRARCATLRGLCQVCGRHLPGRPSPPWSTEPRWCGWFTLGQTIRMGLRDVPLVIDGWTCKPCLDYSLIVCPALVAKRAKGELQLLRIRYAERVATFERPESIPPEQFETSGFPVGMIKIAPLDFDVLTPEEVLAGER